MDDFSSLFRFPKVGSNPPSVMTIAGSDSGGGAGIQADIKTFSMFGVHGTSVIVSVTSQNTVEVAGVYDLPLNVIRSQFETVCSDIKISHAKTGMLSSPEITKEVSNLIDEYKIPIVVDPAMVSESGGTLMKSESVNVMTKYLFSLAKVVTPNVHEAEVLSGIKISSVDSAKKAAQTISNFGPDYVIVTGGHLDASDIIYDSKNDIFTIIPGKFVSGGTHGTGCTYSAAITSCLSLGLSVVESCSIAKKFITRSIQSYIPVGSGPSPVNPVGFTLKCRNEYIESVIGKKNNTKEE
ncbi:MAG: bifunctional hydroxymethylpyrimidine kinase/phosphomethylpyrimidine kinase [Methanosarcinaceae archaeon]|nr:bifunctional hydroxymethylpyrimidine kinase/phosphomethylpyrimidine kinase [Methanosarcinaceae archaeon]